MSTNELSAATELIDKSLDDNGLSKYSISRMQADKATYTLVCDIEGLGLLLGDLANLWPGLDSATLFVEPAGSSEQIVIDGIRPQQIAEIVNQRNYEMQVKAAKYFAALNNIAGPRQHEKTLSALDDKSYDFVNIPKPVLTSTEKTATIAGSQSEAERKVYLTIVVSASE